MVWRDLGATRDVILGDAEALRGVFVNLFLNAAEAMTDGGELRISSEVVAGPRGAPAVIRVRVADQGPGVSGEVADRIFEPFFSTKGEGTGFGLPLALSTVEEPRRDPRARGFGERRRGGGLRGRAAPGRGGGFVSERILVVDDDRSIRRTLGEHLSEAGYEVRTTSSAEEALACLEDFDPALVVTDVRMPGMDGVELLRRVRHGSDADVAVITAYEDMKTAVAAMQAGAWDYLVKPLDLDQIDHLVERCLRERTLRRRVHHLAAVASEGHDLDQLVGRDPKMIEIYKLIGVLTGNRAAVLVTGETGTGKERIARAIHFSSPHAEEPFIAVNCTALPEHLIESELFGHVRGAFTGAVESRRGYFELAGSGTILLDEIGDASPELQSKLLRVLEDQEFFPVGGERPRWIRWRPWRPPTSSGSSTAPAA